jgi:ABC-type sugar transport system ATPase subunit
VSRLIVETRGLRKTYFGKVDVPVLHGIDMQVAEGEFVAIIGQSGSGKSTLLNILGALDRPTAGRVLIDGVDIGTLDEDELAGLRNETVGFIFQFHYLLDEFTCLENALMPVTFDARHDPPRRPHEGGASTGGRTAAARGPGRAAPSDAGYYVRGPESAVRHRPRPRGRAASGARRRADRQPGQPQRPGGIRPHA